MSHKDGKGAAGDERADRHDACRSRYSLQSEITRRARTHVFSIRFGF